MRPVRLLLVIGILLSIAASAAAQGNPTGSIRGQVMDPANLAVPGVTITVASPALQGMRTTVTSENGDFIVPFLPAGEYTVTFELQGFQTQKQTIGVAMAETHPMLIRMVVASVSETVNVVGTSNTEVLTTAAVATTYKKESLERLPVGRTLNDAVTLAPGVTPTGPSGNIIISGGLSFESLYLVNGVVINENLRGQALNLFIEDAVQETKTTTANVSAEYGRFGGGVVNMITKSGGNAFSGSLRVTFNNDGWRSLTPYPTDATVNKITPAYEATLGGPVLRDRLWFFGAGRYTKPEQNRALAVTGINYTTSTDERRYEGKLTYALNSQNNFKASYMKRTTAVTNNIFGQVMDLASLYNNSTDQYLYVVNYTTVLSSRFFIEGQYSKKVSATMDTGSLFTDMIKGTPISDRSKFIGTDNPRFNSPTFCAVCGGGWLEHRDNWDWFAKASYFLSTKRTGSHTLVAGFDNFKEWRKNDNWQSGSEYNISASSAIYGADGTIYPVFRSDNTTYINYLPILQRSVGNDIRTYSTYANDQWQYNDHLSFNIGARIDVNRSKDQSGTSVVKDSRWSPRIGVSYDPFGTGRWTANASFARYVAGISTALVDAGSAGGRQASFSWYYQGPAVNTGSGPYVTADQALTTLWAWFLANGGTDRTLRTSPSIPGVSTGVKDGVKAPSSDEITIGVANQTSKATWRLDYVHREAGDMYGDFLDTSTPVVSDSAGRHYNLTLVGNTAKAKRTYNAMVANLTYRPFARLQVGANYTLSKMRGNANGENVGSGPIRASMDTYPEYRQEAWNWPMGYNPGDQRHKLRAMGSYVLPVSPAAGEFTLGVVQRFDSGVAVDLAGTIDSRPYVTNPGYLTPVGSVSYYFVPRGSFRWDGVRTTDLSMMWSRKFAGHTSVFFRSVLINLFNTSAVINGDTAINTNNNVKTYQAFNPFTTQPQQGINWDYGANFGQPQNETHYQTPRTFNFSVGLRF